MTELKPGDAVSVRSTPMNFAHDRCVYDGPFRGLALVTDESGFQFATLQSALTRIDADRGGQS